MKRLLIIVWLLCPLASYGGQDTQRVEGLTVDSVLVYGPVEVEISQGDPVLLLIRGDQDSLDQQPFFVQGSTLVLGKTRDGDRADQDFPRVKFKLTLPELHSLQLTGSGDVYVKPLAVDDLSVALEGSGDIKIFAVKGQSMQIAVTGSGDIQLAKLELQSLKLVQSGSGDIELGSLTADTVTASLNGSGDISTEEPSSGAELTLNIVGSGDIDFDTVDAEAVEVNIMGSGTASVGASSTLVGNIMGSGEIYYRGNPDIDKSVLGSGSLHKQNQ